MEESLAGLARRCVQGPPSSGKQCLVADLGGKNVLENVGSIGLAVGLEDELQQL